MDQSDSKIVDGLPGNPSSTDSLHLVATLVQIPGVLHLMIGVNMLRATQSLPVPTMLLTHHIRSNTQDPTDYRLIQEFVGRNL